MTLALSLGTTLVLAGCKPLKTGAREEFSRQFSCPEERVEVTERHDTTYGALVLQATPMETPTDEVKKDPGRLAKWQQDQQKKRDELQKGLDTLTLFEVHGCDHTALLGCERQSARHGGPSGIHCFDAPTPTRPTQ